MVGAMLRARTLLPSNRQDHLCLRIFCSPSKDAKMSYHRPSHEWKPPLQEQGRAPYRDMDRGVSNSDSNKSYKYNSNPSSRYRTSTRSSQFFHRPTSYLLPNSLSFYSGHPEYYDTMSLLNEIYSKLAPSSEALLLDIPMAIRFPDEAEKGSRKTEQMPDFARIYAPKNGHQNIDENTPHSLGTLLGDTTMWRPLEEMQDIIGCRLSHRMYYYLLLRLALLKALPPNAPLHSFLQGWTKGGQDSSTSMVSLLPAKDHFLLSPEPRLPKTVLSTRGRRKTATAHVHLFEMDTMISEKNTSKETDGAIGEKNDTIGCLSANASTSDGLIEILGEAFSTSSCSPSVVPIDARPIVINGKHVHDYFIHFRDILKAIDPIVKCNTFSSKKYFAWCTVQGGGDSGQAGALQTAIARALVLKEPSLEPVLASVAVGDVRQVERKKSGQKKARKKFAWVKR